MIKLLLTSDPKSFKMPFPQGIIKKSKKKSLLINEEDDELIFEKSKSRAASLNDSEEKLIQIIQITTDSRQLNKLNEALPTSTLIQKSIVESILEIIKKTLKEQTTDKQTTDKQILAAKTLILLIIQQEGNENIVNSMTPLLLKIVLDETLSSVIRSACCSSLALLHFIGKSNITSCVMLSQIFEKIFSLNHNSAKSELYVSALNAWALLLTIIPINRIISSVQQFDALLETLAKLLNSSHLNIRTATGETIALLLEECDYDDDSDDDSDNINAYEEYIERLFKSSIPTMIKKLSVDSQKFRSKQDRKQQRSIFREVLQYLQENQQPHSLIRLGKKEQIVLDTWKSHQQYNSMCKLLSSDMSIYLAKNNFIRNIFEIEECSAKVIPIKQN